MFKTKCLKIQNVSSSDVVLPQNKYELTSRNISNRIFNRTVQTSGASLNSTSEKLLIQFLDVCLVGWIAANEMHVVLVCQKPRYF